MARANGLCLSRGASVAAPSASIRPLDDCRSIDWDESYQTPSNDPGRHSHSGAEYVATPVGGALRLWRSAPALYYDCCAFRSEPTPDPGRGSRRTFAPLSRSNEHIMGAEL